MPNLLKETMAQMFGIGERTSTLLEAAKGIGKSILRELFVQPGIEETPSSLAKERQLKLKEWLKPRTEVEERAAKVPRAISEIAQDIGGGVLKGAALGYIEPRETKYETETGRKAAKGAKTIGEMLGWFVPFGGITKGFKLATGIAAKIPMMARLAPRVASRIPAVVREIPKLAVPFATYEALAKPEEGETREEAAMRGALIGTMFPPIGAALKFIPKPVAKAVIKRPPTMAEIMKPPTIKPPKPPIEEVPLAQAPEPPKGMREKGFLTTVRRAEKTTDELKQALGEVDPYYRPVTNKNALKMADVVIKSDLDKASTMVLDSKVPVGARKSAIAIRLAKKYEAEKNWEAALEIVENYDGQLRNAGRYIQAVSLWNKLSPESIVRLADRAGKKYETVVPQNVKKIILKRMAEIQKMPEGPEKARETLEVLNYVADQFPLTFWEKLDAFRYQNMLSNPRSHERNIWGNILQTFITRPLDLIGEWTWDIIRHPFNPAARDIKLSGIAKYYQSVFKTIPDAFLAFKEGFRSGQISEKIFDVTASRGMTMIEFLRRQKLPRGLTIITRFMEAQDRFFSVLIGSGEKARLMAKGIAEEEAEAQAKTLAEKYLFRETVGITTKDQASFARAMDGLGKLALEGRRLPVIGKAWSWFVPFVRTSINITKFGVERSPLGFIGGTHTDEQMGKALMGSIITGIGAVLAMQDKITFLPPIDPKAKRLFYDSGRKSLSIRIGDTWVPMWYLGPLAISLALPAAVKYYTTETKEALTEGKIEKIIKIVLSTSRIITEQTPLSGMSDFMKAVSGDIDYSIPGVAARTAGQIIPFEGLLAYINTVLDPVYRKSKTFSENLKKMIPGVTKDLPAYEKVTGEPATRNWTDFFLPYSAGMAEEEFDRLYKERIRETQLKYIETETKRKLGIEEAPKILSPSEWRKQKVRREEVKLPSQWRGR